MGLDSIHLLKSRLDACLKSLEPVEASEPFVAMMFVLALLMTAFAVGAVFIWSR